MLVLSRKEEESIMVGDDVEIKVVGINGNRVKLGIDAPKNLAIHRKEIWVKIQGDQASAPIESAAELEANSI